MTFIRFGEGINSLDCGWVYLTAQFKSIIVSASTETMFESSYLVAGEIRYIFV